MFGLVRKKKYNKLEVQLMKTLIVKNADDITIKELESKLKLETTKSMYWKTKSENPNSNIVVLGTKEDITYIKS
jgi:hypothetical protein